jgi:anti-anti-sigma regulatory factor
MKLDLNRSVELDILTIQGPVALNDLADLKKQLDALGNQPRKIIIDLTAVELIPLFLVQLLLAFVRYCRSIPRPVEFLHSIGQADSLRQWGLCCSGWEHFFHGR